MLKKILIVVGVLVIVIVAVIAFMYSGMLKQMNNTDPSYWEEDIQEIEDRNESSTDTDIVFIGSSSIRKWTTLEADFSGYNVVNHGFGGSKVADSTYYYDRLVTGFTPKVLVFFAGTNNIHGMTDQTDSAEAVLTDIKEFYAKSIEEQAGVPIYYISISPTVARWDVWEEASKANELIREYSETVDYLTFIDTTEVLMSDGGPNKDLLVGDGLHLNEEGYAIWTSIIKPIVTETLDY